MKWSPAPNHLDCGARFWLNKACEDWWIDSEAVAGRGRRVTGRGCRRAVFEPEKAKRQKNPKRNLNITSRTLPTIVAAFAISASAKPLYVDLNSTNPVSPYADWTTAATNIQDAVDVASAGDTVMVTNGVYQTGGRAMNETSNRVAVLKPLMLRSVNGPAVTSIVGSGPNGPAAVRCVYLTDGAVLVGFTLTKGATLTSNDTAGGGVRCVGLNSVVFDCVITGNSAISYGGGAYSGTFNNCTLTNNSAQYGGGAYYGTLNNCTLTGNSASFGGGTYWGILNNCTLTGNSAGDRGGGGGAYWGTLNNCVLTGNSASFGGGAYYGTLKNCTLTGNSATNNGGGAYSATLNNCILFYNSAQGVPNYDTSSVLNYCCTTPLPGGAGNIDAEPQLASVSHLSGLSPCRNAGSAAYASGTDIDGEPWANPPSIGCDEYYIGSVTGPLSVSIQTATANAAITGCAASFTAAIVGRVTASRWEFGDGTIVSNQPYASHAWSVPGVYSVVLRAYNDSNPSGVSATVVVQRVNQPVHYVSLDSPAPQAPYNSWGTAATNIQDAVDAAAVPGALVLVSNGVYQTGGRVIYGALTNRLAVTKPLIVQSVNGPAVTVIRGYQMPVTIVDDYFGGYTVNGDGAVRCVYLTNGASLVGFALTNGATRTNGNAFQEQSGGGVWCESQTSTVSNCLVTGNSAFYVGGGVYYGTLKNCMLTTNCVGPYFTSSSSHGGGAYLCTLNNCTLTGNWSTFIGPRSSDGGGGASSSTLNNCTLTGNSAACNGGGLESCVVYNCTLVGNQAHEGGGAYYSDLYNCKLTGNTASYGGGGYETKLINCTLVGNSAYYAGGAYSGHFTNCIIYYNSTTVGPDYGSGNLNYCCTTPLPGGVGNFTNAPLFVDTNNWSNLRLQAGSPCINAGKNTSTFGWPDLDGRPRIVGGTVDLGAYEFHGAGMSEYLGWLQQFGLSTDGSADFGDPDGDGMNNWQEWRAGINPTNALSVLRMLDPSNSPPNLTVTWQSVSGIQYYLQNSTNLAAQPAFLTLQSNIVGQAGTTSFVDTNAVGPGPFYYRVGVQ